MRRILTLLLVSILCFGAGWADTYSHTFAKGELSKDAGDVTLGNVKWTQTALGHAQFSSGNGVQLGSKNNPAKDFKLSTTGISGTITEVKINAKTGGEGSYTVTVGGTVYGTKSLTTSFADYSFTGSSSGEIVINLKNSSKASYLKSIEITYTTGGSEGGETTTVATPTFSPEGGTYTEAQSVTIACATSGATIEYSTDGTNYSTYSEPITIAETTTLYARATLDGAQSTIASATYTINSEGGDTPTPTSSTIYTKVTSNDQLVAGLKYILVYETTPAFMGEIGSYGASITGPTISDKTVDIKRYEILGMTLGGKEGAWTFDTGDGKYLAWSSGNSLTTLTDATSTNAQWTITANSSGDYILTNVNTTERVLQYNANSPRFACYTSSQKVACLYVQKDAGPAAPKFSPEAGTYTTAQTVTITAGEGATIYYTLDGSEPTTASSVYSAPISVANSTTINAIAVKDEKTSAVATAAYVIKPAAPTASLATGTQVEYATTVTLTAADGLTIYYTTDGTDPTTDASAYTEPIAIKDNITLKAIAVDANGNASDIASWNYTTFPLTITLDPAKGTYAIGNKAVIKVTTEHSFGDIIITYKVNDGEEQDFLESIVLSSETAQEFTLTVNALDSRDGSGSVATATGTYTFKAPAAAKPVITPTGGNYTEPQEVTMTCSTPGSTIYYTLNDGEQQTYDGTAIAVGEGTTTLKAWATANGYDQSATVTATYTITIGAVATPTFGIAAGAYSNSQQVTITTETRGATIYYTTDGSEPTTASTKYTKALNITSTTTIKAIAVLEGRDNSAVATATYTIGIQPVEFSPDGREGLTLYYDQNYPMELYTTTEDATIYYTVYKIANSEFNADDIDSYWAQVADPTDADNRYDGTQALSTGYTTLIKAVAMVDGIASTITQSYYTVKAESEASTTSGVTNAYTIAEMNKLATGEKCTLVNPVQVIWMSTYENNGTTPEYLYIRDNTDYGCIYFGKNMTKYDSYTKFSQGEWLAGMTITGTTNMWEYNFHTQLGTRYGAITEFPSESISTDDVIPEEMTVEKILAGTVDGENQWGRYVHLRQCTITGVEKDDYGHNKGTLVDASGKQIQYYDKFYLYTAGYNGSKDYNQSYFDEIQNNGGTFGIYGVVEYYKGDFQLSPIDFIYIYQPQFYNDEGTLVTQADYNDLQADEVTLYIKCASEGAQVWYKTSNMSDYALYKAGTPITIDRTTTIETYSTLPTLHNDHMVSPTATITLTYHSTPLATIEKDVEVNTEVVVSDVLVGVAVIEVENQPSLLVAKDLGKANNKITMRDGLTDYMRDLAKKQTADWDQSNWVLLDFTNVETTEDLASNYVGYQLTGVHGTYTDATNFRIVLTELPQKHDAVEYEPNNYIVANFVSEYTTADGVAVKNGEAPTDATLNRTLFFQRPQVCEVAMIHWAQWDASEQAFVIPNQSLKGTNKANVYGLEGSVKVDWSFNGGGEPSLTDGATYSFEAVILQSVTAPSAAPGQRRANGNGGYTLAPLNASASKDVTGITEPTASFRQVASITYYNLTGVKSTTPHPGLNIVVTTYTDGTTETMKILK